MPEDLSPPELDGYAVFAQRVDARIDLDAWSAHAERFFSTRLGLAEDRHYTSARPPPRTDHVHFVVAPVVRLRQGAGAPDAPGIRDAFARPTEEHDLAVVERADRGAGLALLALRCPTLWLVARQTGEDPLALRLAAILASILLGPILDVRRLELFGVKTARAKLEALAGD